VRTPDGLYFPLTLPFGPASGPAQFQQRVGEVLGDLEGHGVASYIDDLGLYAQSFEEFVTNLETEILTHTSNSDLELKDFTASVGWMSSESPRVSPRADPAHNFGTLAAAGFLPDESPSFSLPVSNLPQNVMISPDFAPSSAPP
jgi:hypothetical protein